MKIICISCGHKIEMDGAYDNYAGLVRCVTCAALLYVKTEEGELKSLDVARRAGRDALAREPEGEAQVNGA